MQKKEMNTNRVYEIKFKLPQCSKLYLFVFPHSPTQNRGLKTSDVHTLWQGRRSHHLWHWVCKHTYTHTQTLGHPAAVQLDLPLGRSRNQTDKSLTDGSWQRDYHHDRRSVCSCGWWSLQQGDGGWERTLCTFTHLALLSHHTSVWESKSKLLQSVYAAPVHVLHVHQWKTRGTHMNMVRVLLPCVSPKGELLPRLVYDKKHDREVM